MYNDDFKNTLPENFAEKVLLDGISKEDVEIIGNKQASYADLAQLAAKYSDGLIQGSEQISPELSQIMQSSQIPTLGFQSAETYVEAYNEFYDRVWDEANNK